MFINWSSGDAAVGVTLRGGGERDARGDLPGLPNPSLNQAPPGPPPCTGSSTTQTPQTVHSYVKQPPSAQNLSARWQTVARSPHITSSLSSPLRNRLRTAGSALCEASLRKNCSRSSVRLHIAYITPTKTHSIYLSRL